MVGNEEVNAIRRIMKKPLSGYRGSWGEWFYGGEEVKALEAEWAEYFARHDNRRAHRCRAAEEAQKQVADTACRGNFGAARQRRFVRSVEVTAKNQGL